MNLRDLTKKYGRNKGIDIKAVQLFTSQLIVALRHLKKNRVLHADIKPDNILINHRHNKVGIESGGRRGRGSQPMMNLLLRIRAPPYSHPDFLLPHHRSQVKICDFGSAMMSGPGVENDLTPYLVSRFYRAPEVILGLPYGERACVRVCARMGEEGALRCVGLSVCKRAPFPCALLVRLPGRHALACSWF